MKALLRAPAILMAIAGVVDPAITMSGATRTRVAIVIDQPSAAADRVRARVAQDLGASFEIVPAITSDSAAAVVIGDSYIGGRDVDEAVPDTLPVATVTLADAAGGVRIVRVNAPAQAPAGTAIRVGVDLEASGVAGRTSDVIVHVAGLEVGRASHRWADARERWHAAIDALPVGEPPWVVSVATSFADGALAGAAAVADTVVDARRSPFRVEVYEPRPSWATTFVRRALEADARFQVASLSYSSRGISARTRDEAPLSDSRLDTFDVVIVGGLDRLSASDVRFLDRYLRERGGAVVLLPDARPGAGPVNDLLRVQLTERLLEQPATLSVAPPAAAFEASELLVMGGLTVGSDVAASTPGTAGAPVIVSMPRGGGRLMVSGAMDAWRFRAADNAAFDRFWQSTIAGLALAVPPPISVSVTPALLRPGDRADVVVRVRAHNEGPMSATAPNGEPIRLTPAAETGVFRGSFVAANTPNGSRVRADAGGANPQSASAAVVVRADAHPLRAEIVPPLSMLSASHHGIDVAPERVADLERFIRGAAAAPAARVVRHPMRSVWWMLPFAACLSGEWWLRRRRGLR